MVDKPYSVRPFNEKRLTWISDEVVANEDYIVMGVYRKGRNQPVHTVEATRTDDFLGKFFGVKGKKTLSNAAKVAEMHAELLNQAYEDGYREGQADALR